MILFLLYHKTYLWSSGLYSSVYWLSSPKSKILQKKPCLLHYVCLPNKEQGSAVKQTFHPNIKKLVKLSLYMDYLKDRTHPLKKICFTCPRFSVWPMSHLITGGRSLWPVVQPVADNQRVSVHFLEAFLTSFIQSMSQTQEAAYFFFFFWQILLIGQSVNYMLYKNKFQPKLSDDHMSEAF